MLFSLIQTSPIIVTIDQAKDDDIEGVADVLIGALGLTGIMVILAVVLAAGFAGLLIWFRSRAD